MAVEVRIPQLGESVSEGVIARWLKQDGDPVKTDEPLLELETDKATMEITAEAAGQLEIVTPQGSTVRAGTVVARITEGSGRAASTQEKPAREEAVKKEAPRAESPRKQLARESPREEPARAEPPKEELARAEPTRKDPAARTETSDRRLAPSPQEAEPEEGGGAEADEREAAQSPAVRKLVAEHGLDPARITGTGKDRRLTKGDVLRHIETSQAEGTKAPEDGSEEEDAREDEGRPGRRAAVGSSGLAATDTQQTAEPDGIERVPTSLLRRRIAERLVEAQRTAAILTTFNEIDLSELRAVRKRYRERFRDTHGVDLGLMSFFSRACVLALGDVPIVNAQLDGTDIVYHRHVHLGIAVSTERGLVVPVVRRADSMRLAELERAIDQLARLARQGKLVPDQLAGGTFTITNGGVFGSLLSTPILNPPQSGILGMHKIEDRPVAVGGQVVIRPMMYVALSYDHRLVDGEQAVTFLVRVKERLEDPVRMLLEV